MKFRHLQWDSEFFGMPIGELTGNGIPFKELHELKNQGYQLVYFYTKNSEADYIRELEAGGGFLANTKVFYNYISKPSDTNLKTTGIVETDEQVPGNDFIELAIQNGEHSRFATDPKISPVKFREMYTIWIKKSFSRELCDTIFTYRKDGQDIGFCALKKESYLQMILLSVNPAFRGLSIGTNLINASKRECARLNLPSLGLYTQLRNTGAIKLYEKLDFSCTERVEIFHFWL